MTYIPLFDTPDTSGYMIFGYIVALALPALFIASLMYRYRNLKRDEEMLKRLDEDDEKK
jgi:hypothetical protein